MQAYRLIALAVVITLQGCALSPEPSSAKLQAEALANARVPHAWNSPESGPEDVEPGWLAKVADAQLKAFVAEGLAYNADLRVAAARVEEAQARVRVAGSQLFPAVTAVGRAGAHKSSDETGLQGIIASASWELDVWGRVRYGVRASKDQLAASQEDYRYARQSLVATVAKAWFLATEATLQRDLATQAVASGSALMQLAQTRAEVGVGSELDVASASVSLQTYRDSLVQIALAREQSLRALELLLGRFPAAQIHPGKEFQALSSHVPTGLPSDLLERRPDVMAAEKRVQAAFNLTQQARAARLPQLSLGASGSAISSDVFVLNDRNNPVWGIGGKVLAPIFTGGALQGKVQIATAEQQQAVAAYGGIALKAFDDVESALTSESALQTREMVLTLAVEDAERALSFAQKRYKVGSVDFRYVQQQQLAYYAARTNLLHVQAERHMQRVNLYLALGGDFESSS